MGQGCSLFSKKPTAVHCILQIHDESILSQHKSAPDRTKTLDISTRGATHSVINFSKVEVSGIEERSQPVKKIIQKEPPATVLEDQTINFKKHAVPTKHIAPEESTEKASAEEEGNDIEKISQADKVIAQEQPKEKAIEDQSSLNVKATHIGTIISEKPAAVIDSKTNKEIIPQSDEKIIQEEPKGKLLEDQPSNDSITSHEKPDLQQHHSSEKVLKDQKSHDDEEVTFSNKDIPQGQLKSYKEIIPQSDEKIIQEEPKGKLLEDQPSNHSIPSHEKPDLQQHHYSEKVLKDQKSHDDEEVTFSNKDIPQDQLKSYTEIIPQTDKKIPQEEAKGEPLEDQPSNDNISSPEKPDLQQQHSGEKVLKDQKSHDDEEVTVSNKDISQDQLKEQALKFEPSSQDNLPLPLKPFTQEFIQLKNKVMENKIIRQKVTAIPKDATNNIKTLATYLGNSATTDMEKVWAVFYWIGHNIAYNTKGFFSGNLGDCSANSVLKMRTTVCSGYANLFHTLCQELGIEAEVIHGYAKAYGYTLGKTFTSTDHAWNAVKIAGDWCLLDACWGAGHLEGENFKFAFTPFYFLTPPHQFIYKHLPEDQKWQLIKKPWTIPVYEKQFTFSNDWFKYNLDLISHKEPIVKVEDFVTIKIRSPKDVYLLAHVSSNGVKIENVTFIQKENELNTIDAQFPKKGEYKLQIFAKEKTEAQYHATLDFLVLVENVTGKNSGFPTTYPEYDERKCYLFEPKSGSLQLGKSHIFKILIPEVTTVAVIINQKWNYLKKSETEPNVYQGKFLVDGPEVGWYAKFPGKSSFDGLLKYETS